MTRREGKGLHATTKKQTFRELSELGRAHGHPEAEPDAKPQHGILPKACDAAICIILSSEKEVV